MEQEPSHRGDEDSGRIDRLAAEVNKRLAETEKNREPIERQARDRIKVSEVLSGIEQATRVHEGQDEPDRRVVRTAREIWKDEIEKISRELGGGWEFVREEPNQVMQNELDAEHEWRTVHIGAKEGKAALLLFRRPRQKDPKQL